MIIPAFTAVIFPKQQLKKIHVLYITRKLITSTYITHYLNPVLKDFNQANILKKQLPLKSVLVLYFDACNCNTLRFLAHYSLY
jgi:hypothetical protein